MAIDEPIKGHKYTTPPLSRLFSVLGCMQTEVDNRGTKEKLVDDRCHGNGQWPPSEVASKFTAFCRAHYDQRP